MAPEFDFAAYDKKGELRLVVEAKARHGIDSLWAQDLRANIASRVEHEIPALLIATPRAIYAWNRGTPLEDLPDYEVLTDSAHSPLEPYYRRAGISADDFIEPTVFEAIVAQWLQDVTDARTSPSLGPIDELLASIHGGRIVHEAA